MTKLLWGLGWMAVGFGVFTSRLAGESLELLPQFEDVSFVDDNRGAAAIFDSEEFILSTRTYVRTVIAELEAVFLANGFEIYHGQTPSQNGFYLPLDSEWDGLIVHLETEGQDTIASTIAADGDVVAVWPFLALAGASVVLVGIMLLRVRRTTAATFETNRNTVSAAGSVDRRGHS